MLGMHETAQKEHSERAYCLFGGECEMKLVPPSAKPQAKTGQYLKIAWRIVSSLIVFSAAVVLLLVLWFPVFQVQRSSMAPILNDGEIVIFISTGRIVHGDVIAFYHGNNVLIKRVIAAGGDWLSISADGTVYLNEEPLNEHYVQENSTGEELSIQVLDSQFFVMGDQRRISLDSRSMEIGLVSQEQIIGKTFLRIWPLNEFGFVR
jgi:signal peptidase I